MNSITRFAEIGVLLEIPLAVFDLDGAIIRRTPSFDAALGFTPSSLEEMLLRTVDDRETREVLRDKLLSIDPSERLAFRLMDNPGTGPSTPLEVLASSAADSMGRVLLLRLAPVSMEATLLERIEVLERQAVVGQVAAGVAHEFNNILTSMLGWTQIAQRMVNGDAQAASALFTIESNTKRAKQIASELLDLARPRRSRRRIVPIVQIVEEALRLLVWDLSSARIQVTRMLEDVGACECDSTRLLQVFVNIIRNAIEATPAGGSLVVALSRDGDTARISFADSGNGISKPNLERIFEPFFTTKVRKEDGLGGGSGLGLPICRRIVEEHGGAMDVASRRPGGTTMTVSLPLVETQEPEDVGPSETRSSFPPGIAVLVVDDERDIGEMIRTALTLRGASVFVATGGEEALELCAKEHFDAAFVDFSMAGLCGHELGHALAQVQPTLPIVFMSGVEIPEGGTANISDFLKKPFDLHEIQCKLREVLDGANA